MMKEIKIRRQKFLFCSKTFIDLDTPLDDILPTASPSILTGYLNCSQISVSVSARKHKKCTCISISYCTSASSAHKEIKKTIELWLNSRNM